MLNIITLYLLAEVFSRVVGQLFTGKMSQQFGSIMFKIWKDPNTKQAYELLTRLPKIHTLSPLEDALNDSAEYFLDSLVRISAVDYIPSDEDIVR